MEPKKQKDINIWFIATILLAIALVGVIVLKKGPGTIMGADGKESPIMQPKEAADRLVTFFTEVGGAKAGPIEGPVTLNDLIEESGLYKANVTYQFIDEATGKKQPVSPEFYITKDGKMFVEVARMMNIDDAMAQLKKFKEGNAATTSPAVAPAQGNNANIETEPTPVADTSENAPLPQ